MLSTPRDPEIHISNGKHLRSIGRCDEAWSCLGKVLSQNPNCFENLVEKCHLLAVEGYRNRVVEILKPIVRANFSELNEDQLRVLRLQLAAAEVETDGLLKEAQNMVISTWKDMLEHTADWNDNVSDVRCWTLLHLAYITLLLRKYARYTHVMEDSFEVGLNDRMNQRNFVWVRWATIVLPGICFTIDYSSSTLLMLIRNCPNSYKSAAQHPSPPLLYLNDRKLPGPKHDIWKRGACFRRHETSFL